uniref:Transmembrane epididymal protein 1 n=1 Tax=Rhinopithecus bieti TaxID=61621 RepID=A0A2K6LSG9_RHIBE
MILKGCVLYPLCPPRNKQRCSRLWKIAYGGLLKIVTGSLLTFYVVLCLDGRISKPGAIKVHDKEWQHLTINNVLPQSVSPLVLIIYELLLLRSARSLSVILVVFLLLLVLVGSQHVLYSIQTCLWLPWQDDDISDIMFVTTFFCCPVGNLWLSSFWYIVTGPKKPPYYTSPPGPLYKLLQEVEQSEKEDQALLLAKCSP